MKFVKNSLAFLSVAFIIASCASSKQASTVSRDNIKGNWVLNKVTYDGAGSGVRLTLLDEGSEDCVTGSTWVLPNNGYGSYTINTGVTGCSAGQRNIVWSYQKSGDQPVFQYKKLEGGVKAKDITDGYRFKILSADDANMTLQSEVSFEGKPVYINYSFAKQ